MGEIESVLVPKQAQTAASPEDFVGLCDSQIVLNRAVLEAISDAVIVMSPDGLITKVNPAAISLIGLERQTAIGHQALGFITDAHGKSWAKRICLRLENGELTKMRAYLRRVSGELIPIELSVRNAYLNGSLVWRVMILNDISERVKQQRRSNSLSDSLTGLYNRRWLYRAFGSYVGRAEREAKDLCALLIDLDWFKEVNDQIGYQAGDEVLKSVAETLRTNLRAEDAVVRLGGDEFFVVMVMDQFEAMATATRLLEAIKAVSIPNRTHQEEIKITASIGICCLGVFCLKRFDRNRPWLLVGEAERRTELAKRRVKKSGGKNAVLLLSSAFLPMTEAYSCH